ncbi:hypothetical protein [Bradyrhizobium sp. STM 3562]|uniref:hypothetical protein n=1 Tax=Bradyrhizobium sp. STM 3562 TaxID=578924 RepID=UPI00388E60F8
MKKFIARFKIARIATDRFKKSDNVNAMIRKKFPSAISSKTAPLCASTKPAVDACSRPLPSGNRVWRLHFPARSSFSHPCKAMQVAGAATPWAAPGDWPGRQVLPRGRQKTPDKPLKNNEKYSPGFSGEPVQRIGSRAECARSALRVGEWG